MKFPAFLLASIAVATAAVSTPELPPLRAVAGPHAATITSTDGSVADERRGRRARQEVRRRLNEEQDGTYIGDILLDHDSSLARWPERLARPISVWIQPESRVVDWHPQHATLARAAFEDWEATGIPLEFRFVADSADAEVHLTWIDRFREPISGRTLWARDDDWWILDGNITIAVHHSSGETLDGPAVKAIVLHEVGHLIGLDHTPDPTTIMTPKVRVRALTPADKATARLLYTLPAGAVR